MIPDGFRNNQPSCKINYSLREEGKAGFDGTIYTFSPDSPIIVINTDDLDLDMEQQSMILTATSELSGNQATQMFIVTFIDGCRDATLTRPEWSDIGGIVQLYEPSEFYFTKSEASVEKCGEITYRVVNQDTDEEFPMPAFKIDFTGNIPFLRVLVSDRAFAGFSFNVLIEATLGNYVSVESDPPLFLTIENPCFFTELIDQTIPSLVYNIGDVETTKYTVPKYKDTVSVKYSDEFGDGSGSDLCGE